MSLLKFPCLLLTVGLLSCQNQVAPEQHLNQSDNDHLIYYPSTALGDLFHDAQLAGIYPDSKTLVDCQPLISPQEILQKYHDAKDQELFDLRSFLHQNLQTPVSASSGVALSAENMPEHIEALWPILTRSPDDHQGISSLLPLPYPYVVPGGRFREIYYWDSYFTMLGLLESGEDSLMLNMVRNFTYLIDTYGFIPNGNRSYYLGRSQPPFYAAMVMLWADHHGFDQALEFLPAIQKEYDFWMTGTETLNIDQPENLRVVMLPDGEILNRYWDNIAQPRPESYREDFEMVEVLPESNKEQAYRELRAGAESGWDYSSRWFSDGATLDSIITTQIVPVDLNCLIYFMELSISQLMEHQGDSLTAEKFRAKSLKRAEAIRKYFWEADAGYFTDYNFKLRSTTRQFSAAGIVPLYFKIATEEQANLAASYLEKNLLYPGGIVSTTSETGQQWDFPNGWAPQQWMAIQGLRNYNQQQLADEIAQRWLSITDNVFRNTGKMMEKYNVVDLSLSAGGGEYPTQDGFGWTNGVTLALKRQMAEK